MKVPWKKKPGSTVLGIALERDRVEIVELRRTHENSEIRRSLVIPLDADPLSQDPAALSLRLRSQLEQAGIRETRCAVALPASSASTLTIALPDLPDADRSSFLEIEAERGFAQSPESLFVRTSIGEPTAGKSFATLIAFERESIQRLEALLHASKLRPVLFTLGISALESPSASEKNSILSVLPSGNQLVLQVACGGGIAALRVIEDAFIPGSESPELHPDLDLISRELRITLGQLPSEVRDALEVVRVVGPSDQARAFVLALTSRVQSLGLRVELVPELRMGPLPFRLPTQPPASTALAVAVLLASGSASTLNFLPPRISAWQQFTSKHSSRRLTWAGAALGAAAGLAALLFLGQQFVLWRWQSRWDGMKSKVTQLEGMQREVRRYEPWFDPSVRSLSILRRLTESFPEDGSVSAKSIEFRAPAKVACSGTARDPQSWLRMLDTIRNAPGVSDLQVEQVRGKSPIEFSFRFNWQPPHRS